MPEQPESSQEQQQPSEAELRAALEAEFRQIKVEDLIKQSAASLINVGAFKAGLISQAEEDRDPQQATRAIEAAKGLLAQVEDEQDIGPLKDALAQLQLAFVQLQSDAGKAQEDTPKAAENQSQTGSSSQSSSRLWVPGQ